MAPGDWGAGTGKSILAMQAAGANVGAMPVVFVSTETRFRDVMLQAGQFNIDLSDAVSLADVLAGRVKDVKTNLIVIDLFGLAREYRELLRLGMRRDPGGLSHP
ncbi:hypothetical protein [Vulcanisaeta sp. JCM 16161]|uniref:hypothetical protein n=1 Tax=Vulcanisaeta sp. JCM 16161 TaxID=1295372 RepID=UPI0006D04C21|nr:hypothetical protein [Vulcanisaeta sp. JCM 16161]